ncbi:MAG TPA: cupredoxin domain-containing protein [Herpetosiphonaceae bacterium]|nr:cupredoxin domain-containing protein [Herpetosiphonaceae bacterium]
MKRLIVIGLAALLLAGCGETAGHSAHEPAAVTTVTLDAADFSFSPASIEAVAGQPVKIVVKNTGAQPHDFTIRAIPLDGEAHGSGSADHHAHTAGDSAVHVAALVGATSAIEFTPSASGTYEFECSVAGHKDAGMVGTLAVK